MISTRKATKLTILAFAVSLAAACSFTPQKQVDAETAASKANPTELEKSIPDASGVSPDNAQSAELVRSVNPYLVARKSVPAVASKRFNLALEAMKREDWLSAQEHLVWLTQEYPRFSGPYVNLAITYLETNKAEQAEKSFRSAIVANPKNLDAYNQLAILLREQGRFKEAEAEYQAALAVWPEHADSHRNLGILYDLYMGRLEDALHHYHDYQRLNNAPDRQMAGWIVDIERRLNQVAMQ